MLKMTIITSNSFSITNGKKARKTSILAVFIKGCVKLLSVGGTYFCVYLGFTGEDGTGNSIFPHKNR